jgi:hypothetical protein
MREQIARMRSRHPNFRVTFDGGWCVNWLGHVKPLCQRYQLRIVHTSRRWIGNAKITSRNPQIWLVDPPLEPYTHFAPDECIPHIYVDRAHLQNSKLCIFDPQSDDWDESKAIADTIVPWAIDWLVSYEGWHATGKWTGGGRHPDITNGSASSRHQPARALSPLDKVGVPIAKAKFSEVAEGISGAFFPSLSSLNWDSDFLRDDPFQPTSVWQ